jgi:hypothetical protein
MRAQDRGVPPLAGEWGHPQPRSGEGESPTIKLCVGL